MIVLPGPPRELQTMWPTALATPAVKAVLARTRPFESAQLRLFGLPESQIAVTLREVGEKLDLTPLEITTCLRRAELVIDIRHRPGAADALEPGRLLRRRPEAAGLHLRPPRRLPRPGRVQPG